MRIFGVAHLNNLWDKNKNVLLFKICFLHSLVFVNSLRLVQSGLYFQIYKGGQHYSSFIALYCIHNFKEPMTFTRKLQPLIKAEHLQNNRRFYRVPVVYSSL